MMPKEEIVAEEIEEIEAVTIHDTSLAEKDFGWVCSLGSTVPNGYLKREKRGGLSIVLSTEEALKPQEKVKTNRKKRSEIWNHFVKVNQSKGARCYYCGRVLSFAAGSLSNLFRHVRKKHPRIAAGFHHYNNHGSPIVLESTDPGAPLILRVESASEDRGKKSSNENRLNEEKISINSGGSCDNTAKTLPPENVDIESHFRMDHSYGEKPPPKVYSEELFGEFIQSELNKFKNELLKRKCKREILQALMKYQQTEDSLYPSIDRVE